MSAGGGGAEGGESAAGRCPRATGRPGHVSGPLRGRRGDELGAFGHGEDRRCGRDDHAVRRPPAGQALLVHETPVPGVSRRAGQGHEDRGREKGHDHDRASRPGRHGHVQRYPHPRRGVKAGRCRGRAGRRRGAPCLDRSRKRRLLSPTEESHLACRRQPPSFSWSPPPSSCGRSCSSAVPPRPGGPCTSGTRSSGRSARR